MLLSEAVTAYLAPYSRPGQSAETLKAKARELRFLVVVAGDIDTASLSPQAVRALFLARAESLSEGSLNTARAHVRAFLVWAESMIDGAPSALRLMAGWPRQTAWRKDPTWLGPDTFGPLLDSAASPRDRAFVALGLYTLLRGVDICALRVGDVDLDQERICARMTKVRREVDRPLPSEAMTELRRWLTTYSAAVSLTPDMYLVPAQRRGTFGPGRAYVPGDLDPHRMITDQERIVQRALARLGHPTHYVGPHTLRRSGATALHERLVAEGVADARRVVGILLGHASDGTTERYLDPSVTRRRVDDLLRGRAMYPAAAATADNVVPLRRNRPNG